MQDDLLGGLVKLAVRRAEVVRRDAPEILACARAGKNEYGQAGNYAFLQSAYFLGFLHAFAHPENALYGQAWCRETACAFTDVLPQYLKASPGKKAVTAEWSPLGALELMELLRPEPERREAWTHFVERYVEFACERPFGFTSPNHEAWRELFLYRAGQVLRRPELCEMGLFLCKQELTYQTDEGFWEEGRHHGPSMSYNTLMLEPLAWLYRLTGDEEIGAAARRLARFMAEWCFPDGCTVGAFDGRQSTAFGFGVPVCPGLELVAAGRTLQARMLRALQDREGLASSGRGSAWYDHFGLFFLGTALRYYSEQVPAAEAAQAAREDAPLPADHDGTREAHSSAFDGLMMRKGPWVLALSSQNSDIPRQAQSIFRLERGSRIELWHAGARLALGMGHNRSDWPVPYANAVLDTGFAGETEFGWVDQARHPSRRSYYLPHACRSYLAEGCPELALHFAHGSVRFRVCIEDSGEVGIEARWQVRNVLRLCLQVPLVVWHGAALLIDGAERPAGEGEPVRASLEAVGGPWRHRVRLGVPEGVATRVRYPLDPLRYYIDPEKPDDAVPIFRMALLSSQWTQPPREGCARWQCSVRPLS
ncbi:MAG: hypothetical protein KIS92_03860 [Planctomycetota bacterium]|nr:hypothetical protein [Planctomycetota bacterium]